MGRIAVTTLTFMLFFADVSFCAPLVIHSIRAMPGTGGGGPSGFNLRDVSDSLAPPANAQPMVLHQLPPLDPHGTTISADIPQIPAAPPRIVWTIRSDGSMVVQSSNDGGPPVIQPASSTLLKSFTGGRATGLIPADAAGAVNSTYVIAALNNRYNIYNRSGTLVKTLDGNSFWCNGPQVINGCPNTALNNTINQLLTFDTQILWDAGNQRWVTTALGLIATLGTDLPVTYLAVSQTADPTGQWDLYWFYSCGNDQFGDQPKLGINDSQNWLFLELSVCGGATKDNLHVFYQPSIYSGTPPNSTNHFLLSDPNDLDRPVVSYATAVSDWEFLVASGINGQPFLVYSYIVADQNDLPVLTSNYTSLVLNPFVTNESFLIPPGDMPNCNACVGTDDDARVESAKLQTLSNGDPAIVVPADFAVNGGGDALYLIVLDVINPFSPVSVNPGEVGSSPGGTVFYPSLALTGDGIGEILQYGFTTKKAKDNLDFYPSMYQWSFNYSLNIKKGSAATFSTGRWGDYTSIVPDPSSPTAAWALGSFLDSGGNQEQWWMHVTH